MKLLALVVPLWIAVGPDRAVSADGRDGSKRMVLVELYTSQGCNMCPAAEKLLGTLSERDRRIVPIASATIQVTSQSTRAEKTPLLVCAVLREDGVVTDVPSGENAGKSLVARFPARQTKYAFIELDGKSPSTQRFPFALEPTWKRPNLRLAVFVQDKRTGMVHQAADLPWRSTATATTSATSTAKSGPRAR